MNKGEQCSKNNRGNKMIRKFKENDIVDVMQIWIDTNIKVHNFIPKEYWTKNYEVVKEMLAHAKLYVYEDDEIQRIVGFIGLTNNYIAGIFVTESFRSKGIGRQLLDYVKENKMVLELSVYQKNIQALLFYRREDFVIQSESIDESTGQKEYIMKWKNKG